MRCFSFIISHSLFYLFFLSGCSNLNPGPQPHEISSLNIVDRNGFSETISSRDRLDNYQKVDFLKPQPYQKVLRVFGKHPDGSMHSCITSYYPNGQPKQYLEAVNGRAFGIYREWHSNGHKRLEAQVIGGMADLNTAAEESWLFDSACKAWDEEGRLLAEIPYHKGELHGCCYYYHPEGTLWKTVPHACNLPHGVTSIYSKDGVLLETVPYVNGLPEGEAKRLWPCGKIAALETYHEGLLEEGTYFDENGALLSSISKGSGWKAVIGNNEICRLEEYRRGIQEGGVKEFGKQMQLKRTYAVKNGLKHGEEIFYQLDAAGSSHTVLSVNWSEGLIQGHVKTWYDNGVLESQKEMSLNKKNGMCTAWYRSGHLMLFEEYRNDNLVRGEYFRKGDPIAASKVLNGKGTATLFDAEGRFIHKVSYRDGKAVE